MKKLTILLLALIATMLISTVAVGASLSRGDITLPHIVVLDDYMAILTVVNVENHLSSRVDDIRVTVTIPELGIRTSSRRFDLKGGRETTRQLLLELNDLDIVDPREEIWVRIVVSSDEGRRVKHRPLFLI